MAQPGLRVRWTRPALDDLRDAAMWIARDSPAAADAVVSRVFSAGDGLSTFPRLGREHAATGSRLLPVRHTSLMLVYELTEGSVVVLQVRHMAKRPYGSPDQTGTS